MASGGAGGLFSRRKSTVPQHSTMTSSTNASTSSTPAEDPEPRRRHGSVPLVFGLGRRESTAAPESESSGARRSSTVDLNLARKSSEPGMVHKPSLMSPKRKPLPKGSAFQKQSSKEDEINDKLGKMELTNGSTMVIVPMLEKR